mmetsp:Transcript_31410/g.43584  ORF Transcript_31410/g.43584 Transcript_31410/m.43584 type:complete len:502 (+) Transcript_31410:1006-2511(+)
MTLSEQGAKFDIDRHGALHLTREGGHAHNRIVHAADLTGAEIERTLLQKVNSHANIEVFENHFATDFVTEKVAEKVQCLGVDCFSLGDGEEAGVDTRFLSVVTMLAAGGSGHIYPSTTNPAVATGDGIAMAARAGAEVTNLEFMQFHPTSFYVDNGSEDQVAKLKRENVFLISEAVRGEGGILLNGDGERFMSRYDPRLELAPRDVVARAIDAECKSRGEACAFLDISHKPAEELRHHFPNILERCLSHGIDITKDSIPVKPAMHYTCGGVQTDLDAATSIAGLYACGEAAHTGLHGANRLASNSLLEGLVFASKGAKSSITYASEAAHRPALVDAMERAVFNRASLTSTQVLECSVELPIRTEILAYRRQLQDTLWDSAGIVRSTQRLREGQLKIQEIGQLVCRIPTKGFSARLMMEWYELANLLTVAELVVMCALMRKESRGLHYTEDFPFKVEEERHPSTISSVLKLASRLDAVHSKKFRTVVKLNKLDEVLSNRVGN